MAINLRRIGFRHNNPTALEQLVEGTVKGPNPGLARKISEQRNDDVTQSNYRPLSNLIAT
jgi:hypothetical protein